jgi:hypothetical protein
MSLIIPANSAAATGFDVANSCRFNSTSSDKLTRTFGSGGSVVKWTYSTWFKISYIGGNEQVFFSSFDNGDNYSYIKINGNNKLEFRAEASGSDVLRYTLTRRFRDPSAFMHLVVALDSSLGTAGDRIKIWINGVRETVFDASTAPSQDATTLINSAAAHEIGHAGDGSDFFNGYMSQVGFINNAQYDADQFGEFDNSGIWKPIDISGLTFGQTSFFLDFETDGTNTAFIDSGPDARAVTVTGGVDHSFTQAKFGGSSIFFDGTDDSLDIADSTDFDFGTGNFTFEFWVYKTASGKAAIFETRASDDNDGFNLEFNSTGNGAFEWYDTSIASGNDLPKDGSAIALNTWTHFAVVRNGSSCKMYRDGTAVGTEKDVGTDSQVSAGTPTIGESAAGANDFQGYLDEIRLSSTARYTGNFTAPSAAFTSDSDTVLLIQSKASNLLGGDKSGVGNHLTTTNLAATDQSTDTCTNNFATMNPLDNFYGQNTLSEGNLKMVTSTTTGDDAPSRSTIGVASGKWFWEVKVTSNAGASNIGAMADQETADDQNLGHTAHGYSYKHDGNVTTNNDNITSSTNPAFNGSTYTDGDIIGVALNLDDNNIIWYKNGSVQNSGTGIAITAAASTPLGFYFAASSDNTENSSTSTHEYNFGSPPYAISSGNTDGNGYGNFEYAVPNGYYSLNSKNLSEYG